MPSALCLLLAGVLADVGLYELDRQTGHVRTVVLPIDELTYPAAGPYSRDEQRLVTYLIRARERLAHTPASVWTRPGDPATITPPVRHSLGVVRAWSLDDRWLLFEAGKSKPTGQHLPSGRPRYEQSFEWRRLDEPSERIAFQAKTTRLELTADGQHYVGVSFASDKSGKHLLYSVLVGSRGLVEAGQPDWRSIALPGLLDRPALAGPLTLSDATSPTASAGQRKTPIGAIVGSFEQRPGSLIGSSYTLPGSRVEGFKLIPQTIARFDLQAPTSDDEQTEATAGPPLVATLSDRLLEFDAAVLEVSNIKAAAESGEVFLEFRVDRETAESLGLPKNRRFDTIAVLSLKHPGRLRPLIRRVPKTSLISYAVSPSGRYVAFTANLFVRDITERLVEPAAFILPEGEPVTVHEYMGIGAADGSPFQTAGGD